MTVVYLYSIVVMVRPRLIFYLFFWKKRRKTHIVYDGRPRGLLHEQVIIYMCTRVYIGSLECKRIERSVAYGNSDNNNNNTNNNNNNTVYKRN